MDKIAKMEGLTQEALGAFVKKLTSELGYDVVEDRSSVIIGAINAPLSITTSAFIIFNERLSANSDKENIVRIIADVQKQDQPNSVYIVSQHNITNGFRSSLSPLIDSQINFLGRDHLIELADKYYPEFWKHDDTMLLEWEKSFYNSNHQDSDIKKLKVFNDKYQKLLDIYIEPRITYYYTDKKTQSPIKKRVTLEDIVSENEPVILTGNAGAGKSTFLKKIGETLIIRNTEGTNKNDKKNFPVFLTIDEIFENDYNISDSIKKKVTSCLGEIGNNVLYQTYNITLLIDTIDELEDKTQESIIKELLGLYHNLDVRFIIGTRNYEKILDYCPGADKHLVKVYNIDKFNSEQVKKFIASFFLNEKSKADNLLEALKENRIIERLPITPLSLSLISILYEENNFEIPATIADIYDNFNSLIIGRSTVASRIEFIDVSFKERILSLYALHLLEQPTHRPLSKDEFITFFVKYFEGKTLPIRKGTLDEVLEYLIAHTGILVLNNKWVQFSHDSYLEYYAAQEIFKHQREKEDLLVDNFFEHNWQNTAVFYAGKSKDMPNFLTKIIEKLKSASKLDQYYMGVLGCGYLLQALYQTDNQLRCQAVCEAVNANMSSLDTVKKLSADDNYTFKGYSLPLLQMMALFYFYEVFNSITLKEPLKLAFAKYSEQYYSTKDSGDGFKALKLALTLDSKRIMESYALERMIEEKSIFKDPSLYLLLDFSLGIMGNAKYHKLKEDIRKNFDKIEAIVKDLIKLPANKLRFTNLDTIRSNKRVKLVVEGKTDAELIEHAYYVLSQGHTPYWNMENAGGAGPVANTIKNCAPIIGNDDIIIGIFDHDAKGIQEYNGLKDTLFTEIVPMQQKKNNACVAYAILLPVPSEDENYLKKDQLLNYFEIEHYFGYDILNRQGVIEESEIPGIYKIKESKKSAFSNFIRSSQDASLFQNFILLFDLIDKLAGVEIEYLES